MLGIKCVTDDDFTGFISPTLLKMVTIGNLTIIMALPTSSFGAVRDFTFERERIPIETLKGYFLMDGVLAED